jgi:hypothetical protein
VTEQVAITRMPISDKIGWYVFREKYYSVNSGISGYSASPVRRRNKYTRDDKCDYVLLYLGQMVLNFSNSIKVEKSIYGSLYSVCKNIM